ncbi:MAG: Uma2 family endonuclease [Pseudanabaena sp.]
MVQALERNCDRHFAHDAISWEKFKVIQSGFENVPNIRLTYCERILEIIGIGKAHEMYTSLLSGLLSAYFEIYGIEFFPSGAYSQIIPNVTEFQADLSYCFGQDKDIPDLCIEVLITSGSPSKLRKYQLRGVPEVWFWEDGAIAIYCLENHQYVKVSQSQVLPNLDLALLCRCLLLSSPLAALREFRKGINL